MTRSTYIRNKAVVIAEFARDGQNLVRVLGRNGIRISQTEGLVLVVARNVMSNELGAINRWQLERRRPWLLIKAAGERLWVGPLFVPGVTGCWECLAHRLRENGWKEDAAGPGPRSIFERTLEQFKDGAVEGSIREFTAEGEPLEVHTLIWRPQCPACGSRSKSTGSAFRLRSCKKIAGGTRTCSAEDTVAQLARYESDLTGIISNVKQAPHWRAFPACLAKHCRPLPLPWPSERLPPAPQPVAGKGASEGEARASCLAEAIERYSIQWQGNEPRRLARRGSLGEKAIGFEDLALFSRAQLDHRQRWNREHGGFNLIPELPAAASEIEWTPVWSLTARRRRYVPTAYCYLYYPETIYFSDSNGCAAGNTIEEAIVHAFLELVERDAVGIWWYNRLRRPPVKVEGYIEERYRQLRRELADRGRTLAVLDLTTDFDIPVFAAVSARQDGSGVLLGTGAHLKASIALGRALGELCQVVESLGLGIGRPHGRLTTVARALRRWFRGETLDRHPYLTPRGKRKPLAQFRDWSQSDVKLEVEWCVERARSLGLEVLVLDMTRRDIGFPVARVIVPGMRHCWGRLAGGRLYKVPVDMGWRKRELRERDLNPIAYFL